MIILVTRKSNLLNKERIKDDTNECCNAFRNDDDALEGASDH